MLLFDIFLTGSISYLLLNIHYINSNIVLLMDLCRKMVSRTNHNFNITHPDCHSCWCSAMAPLDVEQIKQGNIPLIIRQGKKVNFKNIFLVVTKKQKDMKQIYKRHCRYSKIVKRQQSRCHLMFTSGPRLQPPHWSVI